MYCVWILIGYYNIFHNYLLTTMTAQAVEVSKIETYSCNFSGAGSIIFILYILPDLTCVFVIVGP